MNRVIVYRLNFLFISLLSGYTLFSLLSIPGDPKKAILFGLSYERLLLISFPLLLIIIGGYLFAKTWWDKDWITQFDQKIQIQLARQHQISWIALACGLFVVFGGVYLRSVSFGSFYVLAPPEHRLFSYMVYYVDQIYSLVFPYLLRLKPLIILLMGICVQVLIMLFTSKIEFQFQSWITRLKTHYIFYMIIAIYGALIAIWKIIGWTHIRLSPDFASSEWLALGTPILETQVLLALFVGIALIGTGILIRKFTYKSNQPDRHFAANIDRILISIIWLTAICYWLSFPAQEGKFFNKPWYPNYAYYPNSDALTYDTTAQNLLVGVGYKTRGLEYPRRPVYALFLAYLYSVVGQNYQVVTMVQSALLGVFPVLVYLLTARFSNRLSGLIAALLIILREGNGIYLANYITDSNSRILMSEMPASVGIALSFLIVDLWVRKPERRSIYSLLLGGVIAIFMLVRIEVEIFLLLFIVYSGVLLFRTPKKWLTNAFMAFLGAILCLTPWIWRNWQKTEHIYIEEPSERVQYFLVRSGYSGSEISPDDEIPHTSPTGSDIAGQFFQRIVSHYLNSQIQAVLIFPDAYRIIDSAIGFFGHRNLSGFIKVCCSRQDYISRFYPLWHDWNGSIPFQSIIPILANLLILVVGFVKLWEKYGITRVFPFLAAITYYLASSVVRVSGGRFVQIVDWIWIIYYSVGLGCLATWLTSSLVSSRLPGTLVDQRGESDSINSSVSMPQKTSLTSVVAIGLAIFSVGALLPLTEYVIKPRYTQQTKQMWLGDINQSKYLLSKYPMIIKQIGAISPSDPRVFQGRALYPRYYPTGESDQDYELWNAPRDFDRFSFYMVGPVNTGVIVPLEKEPSLSFPQAADVLVIGCQEKEFLRALVVYVKTTDTLLLSSPLSDSLTCPEPIVFNAK